MARTEVSDVVYLDTNALIEAFETSSAAQRNLTTLMWHGSEAGTRLVTSRISMAEALVKPLRDDDAELVGWYMFVFDGTVLDVRDVDAAVLYLAALLRADNRRLRLFDAIHLATARAVAAAIVVSRDDELSRVRPGTTCRAVGEDAGWPVVCTPDDPRFLALVERHA